MLSSWLRLTAHSCAAMCGPAFVGRDGGLSMEVDDLWFRAGLGLGLRTPTEAEAGQPQCRAASFALGRASTLALLGVLSTVVGHAYR